MARSTQVLNPSEAAQRLSVSVKALRLYEERGLLRPARTDSGWRAYGPEEMSQAAQIVALRGLGFSLVQVGRVLNGSHEGLEQALAEHQAALEDRARVTASAVERVSRLRGDIAQGKSLAIGELAHLVEPPVEPVTAFDLPWPWDGERFELYAIRKINFIIGPLGSGKTRFAQRLAEEVPGAAFFGLDRLTDGKNVAPARMLADPTLKARVEAGLVWLVEDGASVTDALLALLVGLEDGAAVLIVDMVEQELGEATQVALIAWLRRRAPLGQSLFLMTRSNAILDLAAAGPGEAIIFCPANHSLPLQVAPCPGSPGYEAVATCLAPPAVRSRTEGMIAWLPKAG